MVGFRFATLCGLALSTTVASAALAQLGIEMKLANAGFTMRTANTPEQLQRLRAVPARRFVARTHKGARHYIYADPDGCKCALIGDERAMQAYRDMVKPPPLPPGVTDFQGAGSGGVNPEHEIIHEFNEDIAPAYGDDILSPGF
jgi:hypothetical protein